MPSEKDMFGLCARNSVVLSWTIAYGGDSYVIPVKKRNYAPVEKTGMVISKFWWDDGQLQTGVAWPREGYMP